VARPPDVHAVMITYRRPEQCEESLLGLLEQGVRLKSLVLVDNSPQDAYASRLLEEIAPADRCECLAMPDNVGPAGGFAAGLLRVLEYARDEDWVLMRGDDDGTPAGTLAEILAFAEKCLLSDEATVAVGGVGGRMDWRAGRVRRPADDELEGMVPVDHLGGGFSSILRVDAIRKVGTFDASLFFGFEELEYGLRLCEARYSLYAHGDMWRRARAHDGRLGLPADLSSRRLADPTWRTYYSQRNLLVVLRRYGGWWPAAKASVRILAKPVVNLPIQPARGWRCLRIACRATFDAWFGRLGRRVEPR